MNRVIVIGTDHYNTLWLIRSLGMEGLYVTTIIINPESNKSFACKSRYCKESYIVRDFDEMIRLLCNFSFNYKVPVFANGDAGAVALDESYDLLSKKYILHHCNHKQGDIKYWMDKSNMLSLAKKVGIKTPFSLSVDLSRDPLNFKLIPFPCLIKPKVSASSSKNSFRVCNDVEQLKQAVKEIREDCAKVLIQEYVIRDYEYLVYGVSTSSEIILPGGLIKVHTCKDTMNLGMASYAYLSDEIPKQIVNFDSVKSFIREMGYYGLFSIEFMITKDNAYFLEVNLRNDGTCYFTTQAGVNIPALWAFNSLGKDASNLRKSLVRSRTYGMNEINYIKYTLKSQSIVTSLKEILCARAFSLCKWNDMRPVFAKIYFGVQNALLQNIKANEN